MSDADRPDAPLAWLVVNQPGHAPLTVELGRELIDSLNEKKEISKRFDELSSRFNLLIEYDNENYLMN